MYCYLHHFPLYKTVPPSNVLQSGRSNNTKRHVLKKIGWECCPKLQPQHKAIHTVKVLHMFVIRTRSWMTLERLCFVVCKHTCMEKLLGDFCLLFYHSFVSYVCLEAPVQQSKSKSRTPATPYLIDYIWGTWKWQILEKIGGKIYSLLLTMWWMEIMFL